jgi:hypothetical protein
MLLHKSLSKSRANGLLFLFCWFWLKIWPGVLAMAFFSFGDTLLHGIAHTLHLSLEILEAILDQIFVQVFDLSHHHAAMATAYSGLVLALFAGYFILRKVYELLSLAGRKIRAWWRAMARRISCWVYWLPIWPGWLAGLGILCLGVFFLF